MVDGQRDGVNTGKGMEPVWPDQLGADDDNPSEGTYTRPLK